MSRGRGPRVGCPPPEGVDGTYPLVMNDRLVGRARLQIGADQAHVAGFIRRRAGGRQHKEAQEQGRPPCARGPHLRRRHRRPPVDSLAVDCLAVECPRSAARDEKRTPAPAVRAAVNSQSPCPVLRPPAMATTVGLVGVGLLGSAVAARLLKAGHRVVGFDTAPARGRALQEMGGRAAHSARAVALESDAVCTLLPSLPTVEAAILGPEGIASAAKAGQVVMQMSTISPALTERLASESRARGLDFLDCPISGTSAVVAQGEGIVFVGGERALFERWRPLLESMLPRAVYIGRPGQE